MEQLIQYFTNIPTLDRAILIVGGITFFWLLEGVIPLVNFKYKKWKHAIPNLFFTLTTILINLGFAFLLLQTADWVTLQQIGVLFVLPKMPFWAFVVLGILFLDFVGAYVPHFIEHKIKPLWMIHLVHHTDSFVDTTTANRHHPLESIIRFFFTLLGVVVIGLPIGVVMLYQSLSLLATQLTHANIKLPQKIDIWMSYVLVSPNMHKVHHHYMLPYTDSNYGNIFSVWDRLFGTFETLDPTKIVYGVDVFPDTETNGKISTLLKQPFQEYQKPTQKPQRYS